jgi:3-hydroxy-3-methylglutaryl CoA synthase
MREQAGASSPGLLKSVPPTPNQGRAMARGILAFGAYVPWRRLQRKAIADTHAWFAPGLKGQAKGERAFCNWDEDPVTMAVEAARDCLVQRERDSIAAVRFASTTFPFLDRLHSGVVAEALSLREDISTVDVTATQRAATSALMEALAGDAETLVLAAEKRVAKAASPVEMTSGDGAAAILVGEGKPIARLLGKATRSADFVDHYRSMDNPYDYQWEERWVRDAGYSKIVPPTIARCLEQAKVAAADVAHFCMPGTLSKVANTMAKAAGVPDKAVCDPLHVGLGDTGAAHALVLLVSVLEKAKAGEKVLLVGFGQGADALLLEVTAEIGKQPKRLGVAGHLVRRKEDTAYGRYLAFNDLIVLERGMRAETDKMTPLSSMWRNRATVTSFIGGKCSKCGTIQFPKTDICVNPNCNAIGTQEPHAFADMAGRIKSYTADRLTYSPDPPACYGMIEFEEGGRAMLDFTDIDAEHLAVGQSMRMMFRIKDFDANRGFRRYYWKAAPAGGTRKET